MQGTTLWEGSTCPLCGSQGINSKLKFYRLNLRVAALLCKRKKCPFPLSTNYPDTFVRVGRDGKIIPGSQSERGWPHEEEADSDDSPYISDASEESVKFPDSVPEVKPLHNVSSENTNEKGALEVDAFDISSIDFETDDSMDTFKLRNEITSLEMEIRKCVENMKSVPRLVNCEGSSVLKENSDECKNSDSVSAKTFTNSDGNVSTDMQNELDINGVSCVTINENEVEWCNGTKSGDIILREHDSPTGVRGSHEHTKTTEVLADCVQQSEVNTLIPNKCIPNHEHAEVQNNNDRNFGGGGCTDDGDIGGGLENMKSISNGNGSDSDEEKELDVFSIADTSNPEPEASVLLTAQNLKNTVENGLPRKHLLKEFVSSRSVTITKDDYGKEMCNDKEVVIICDDHKNNDCSDSNMGKQLDTVPVEDTSNSKPEQSVLLTPEGMKNTAEICLPRNHELLAELVSAETVIIKNDNDCGKEMCDNKEVVIIFDDHKNSDCSDNNVGKPLDTVSVADTSNPEPEPSMLLTTESMKNTVRNGLPRNHELLTELVSGETVTIKNGNDCGKEMCDNKDIDIIFNESENKDIDIIFNENENSDVYEIVAIEKDTSSTACLNNSENYEVINLQLRFCENQKSSGDNARRKTTKVHHSAPNTTEQHGRRSSVANSVSSVSSSVSEGTKTKQCRNFFPRNNGHSKDCVCFLCTECNTKGITSHLDRALADLFPEEHSVEKQVTERELPTEKEVMRDFVNYIAGNSSLQNTKRSPKKRKRLFHL